MFNVCIDVPKGPSYYPKISCFSLTCYHETYYATTMPLEKIYYMKTNTNFWDPGTDPLQSVGSRTLFYPITIMPKTFIEDSSNIQKRLKILTIPQAPI